MEPLLVADVGGTHVRFGICLNWQTNPNSLQHHHIFLCSKFENFNAALNHYAQSLPYPLPKHTCIAVAGPVTDIKIKLTNLHWHFSVSSLRQEFKFEQVEIINDFAAQALASSLVPSSSLHTVRQGIVEGKAARAIIGPGTGLGMAGLYWFQNDWRPLPGEGGHMGFSPGSDLELEILKYLNQHLDYVSLESLLSGPGLNNIYQALVAIEDHLPEDVLTENILQLANKVPESIFHRAVQQFIDILAAAAGDIALVFGAKGGVYIGGGLSPHLLPFINKEQFSLRFLKTGFRRQFLSSVPVYFMLHPYPGLVGAAIAYKQQTKMGSRAPQVDYNY